MAGWSIGKGIPSQCDWAGWNITKDIFCIVRPAGALAKSYLSSIRGLAGALEKVYLYTADPLLSGGRPFTKGNFHKSASGQFYLSERGKSTSVFALLKEKVDYIMCIWAPLICHGGWPC